VNAAETHETIHLESGMRYQHHAFRPIQACNQGVFWRSIELIPGLTHNRVDLWLGEKACGL
jgi:hypothetical protein